MKAFQILWRCAARELYHCRWHHAKSKTAFHLPYTNWNRAL